MVPGIRFLIGFHHILYRKTILRKHFEVRIARQLLTTSDPIPRGFKAGNNTLDEALKGVTSLRFRHFEASSRGSLSKETVKFLTSNISCLTFKEANNQQPYANKYTIISVARWGISVAFGYHLGCQMHNLKKGHFKNNFKFVAFMF